MKKTLKTILFLLIVNLVYSQATYIPMPAGCGLPDGNGGLHALASLPFFEYNGFIYCYTSNGSNINTDAKIAKVNATTNEVTILTGAQLVQGNKPSYIKIFDGKIYFLASNSKLHQINPTTNSLVNLSDLFLNGVQVSTNYLITNNRLYFQEPGSAGRARTYDFNNNSSQYLTHFDALLNQTQYLNLYDFELVGNLIFGVGGVWQIPPHNKIYTINTNTNLVGRIEPNGSNQGTYYGLIDSDNNQKYFHRINNNLVCLYYNGNGLKYQSLNTSNLTVNTDLFTYTNDCYSYVFNNLLYINQGANVYTTNGNNTPALTNLPAFSRDVTSPFLPIPFIENGGSQGVLITPNFVIGKRNMIPFSSYELWTTDGTFANSYNFKTLTTLQHTERNSAIVNNNKIYFYAKETNDSAPKIFQSNRTNTGTFSIFNFSSIQSSGSNSYLFSSGNYLFFSTLGGLNRGLYKIDLTTLSTNQNSLQPNISYSPNPTTSSITFTQEINSLEIFDITGKKVKTFVNSATTFTVDDLENGIYLLKGKTIDGTLFNEKLIKN